MKKCIITSALALALAFSLCACTDNTSATESYSDSTSGTTASGKSSPCPPKIAHKPQSPLSKMQAAQRSPRSFT